jgi:hypothetical protein
VIEHIVTNHFGSIRWLTCTKISLLMLRTANEGHFNGAVWFTRRGDSAAKLIPISATAARPRSGHSGSEAIRSSGRAPQRGGMLVVAPVAAPAASSEHHRKRTKMNLLSAVGILSALITNPVLAQEMGRATGRGSRYGLEADAPWSSVRHYDAWRAAPLRGNAYTSYNGNYGAYAIGLMTPLLALSDVGGCRTYIGSRVGFPDAN